MVVIICEIGRYTGWSSCSNGSKRLHQLTEKNHCETMIQNSSLQSKLSMTLAPPMHCSQSLWTGPRNWTLEMSLRCWKSLPCHFLAKTKDGRLATLRWSEMLTTPSQDRNHSRSSTAKTPVRLRMPFISSAMCLSMASCMSWTDFRKDPFAMGSVLRRLGSLLQGSKSRRGSCVTRQVRSGLTSWL